MKARKYISEHYAMLVKATKGTKIFPSVMVAQAVLLSSDEFGKAGNNVLARKYNNHFAIMADGWSYEPVEISKGEFIYGRNHSDSVCFKQYTDPKGSFLDYMKYIVQSDAHQETGVLTARAPYQQIEAIQRVDFANDEKYVEAMWSIIEEYNLIVLDVKLSFERSWFVPPMLFKRIEQTDFGGTGFWGWMGF